MAKQLDSKIPAGPVAEKWTNYKAHQRLVNPKNKLKLDVIVVGTGLAGASAAASLGEMGFNVLNLAITLPLPVILALMFSEMKHARLSKGIQFFMFLPHFLSIVVYVGIVWAMLDDGYGGGVGVINVLIEAFGGERINFKASPQYSWAIMILSNVIKSSGWGSIIYLAAITGVDVELYDAAALDGVNRFQKAWYITLPTVMPIVTLNLVTSLSGILGNDSATMLLWQTQMNLSRTEVLSTYVLKYGINNMQYSYATAIGLFQSVIGVILGIKFGVVAFLIIPVGNILGGAVHDFVAGMMSLRHDGANLPKLIRITLGKPYYAFFSVFMCFLLLLVVAVFINVPAAIFNILTPGRELFWLAVAVIFLYYICATMFPVDKIIGMVYPFFGALLMIGSLALFIMLVKAGFSNPELFQESAEFKAGMFKEPIIPLLFVTIACGILSGFHATQSPTWRPSATDAATSTA